MANKLDLSGNDLVVGNVYVGASTPGGAGTLLAGSELTVLDGVTAGTAAASKAVVADSSINVAGLNVVGLARIDLDSATATLSSDAATITKWSAVITTESKTTAAGAIETFVITKTGVAAGDLAFVTRCGGTDTKLTTCWSAVCTTDTVTVKMTNAGGSALDGTVKFNLVIHKA
jgi:hypothetical protein